MHLSVDANGICWQVVGHLLSRQGRPQANWPKTRAVRKLRRKLLRNIHTTIPGRIRCSLLKWLSMPRHAINSTEVPRTATNASIPQLAFPSWHTQPKEDRSVRRVAQITRSVSLRSVVTLNLTMEREADRLKGKTLSKKKKALTSPLKSPINNDSSCLRASSE